MVLEILGIDYISEILCFFLINAGWCYFIRTDNSSESLFWSSDEKWMRMAGEMLCLQTPHWPAWNWARTSAV